MDTEPPPPQVPSKPRRSPLRKGACLFFALLGTYCVCHVLLALYPWPLFSHSVTRGRYTLYLREEVPPEATGILDRVEALVSASDLDVEGLHHSIYVFNDQRLIEYLLLRNVHFGARLPSGSIYISDADVKRDVARCVRIGPMDERRRTLSESIAHEIAHSLLRHHLGWRAERAVPGWIKEGYCEFVARGQVIDEALGLSLLKADDLRSVPGFPQFRNRLMMEFLIRERGLTIEAILRHPPEFDEVLAGLLAGLRADERAFLAKLRSRDTRPPSKTNGR